MQIHHFLIHRTNGFINLIQLIIQFFLLSLHHLGFHCYWHFLQEDVHFLLALLELGKGLKALLLRHDRRSRWPVLKLFLQFCLFSFFNFLRFGFFFEFLQVFWDFAEVLVLVVGCSVQGEGWRFRWQHSLFLLFGRRSRRLLSICLELAIFFILIGIRLVHQPL